MRGLYIVELGIIAVVVAAAAVVLDPLRTPAVSTSVVPVSKDTSRSDLACGVAGEVRRNMQADLGELANKRVAIVGSKSFSDDWCRHVCSGTVGVLDQCGAQVRRISLDGESSWSQEKWKAAAGRVRTEIESFKPDAVIVVGEPAWRYVGQAYGRELGVAIVFSDVESVDIDEGSRPTWATGMTWSPRFSELIQTLRPYAAGNRVGVLSAHGQDDDRYRAFVLRAVAATEPRQVFVETFEQWKHAYVALSGEVDMLILTAADTLAGWDRSAAMEFVRSRSRVPVGTCDASMRDLAMVSCVRVADEQGIYAATAVVEALRGRPADQIAIRQSQWYRWDVSTEMASRLGIQLDVSLLDRAGRCQGWDGDF